MPEPRAACWVVGVLKKQPDRTWLLMQVRTFSAKAAHLTSTENTTFVDILGPYYASSYDAVRDAVRKEWQRFLELRFGPTVQVML